MVERTLAGCAGLLISPVPDRRPKAGPPLVREATVTGSAVVLEIEAPLDPAARQVWSVRRPPGLGAQSRPGAAIGDLAAAAVARAFGRRRDGRRRRLAAARRPRRFAGLPARSRTATPGRHHPRRRNSDSGRRRTPARRRASGSSGAAGHAQRGWDDLVLPRDQKQQLGELAARYRRRAVVHRDWGFPALPSGGVVALFSGASGTGKTLAAEVIAGDLGLDLYKVDLAGVVSKYIGETEKNLSRSSTPPAPRSGAVLRRGGCPVRQAHGGQRLA